MLQSKFQQQQILLASQSPRRQELLKGLGLDYKIVRVDTDETYPPHLKREQITAFISLNKANAYTDLKKDEILITADTLVWLEGQVLGKPQDEDEAFTMIRQLAGKVHQVFTSVTVKSIKETITFSDTTDVYFDEFTDEEIHYYIQHFQPFDKAGSYGIQDWLGYAKIKKIDGCYYNVMGLPLRKLYQVLSQQF